ncbi:hypothetical protein HPP92_002078 [Vanilla planifolia]|uniref:Uncharacterized protein n=1 Tax=Vanilla planifolia TaxID=51239 RepID=A0A835S5I4_VANPL|nr:hypothetical protein HPP92_002078 [Vanilla planifolia]
MVEALTLGTRRDRPVLGRMGCSSEALFYCCGVVPAASSPFPRSSQGTFKGLTFLQDSGEELPRPAVLGRSVYERSVRARSRRGCGGEDLAATRGVRIHSVEDEGAAITRSAEPSR